MQLHLPRQICPLHPTNKSQLTIFGEERQRETMRLAIEGIVRYVQRSLGPLLLVPLSPRDDEDDQKHENNPDNQDDEDEPVKLLKEAILMNHLRMSALYWACNTVWLLKHEHLLFASKPLILEWIQSARNADGGYGGDSGLQSTTLTTLSALQCLHLLHSPLSEGQSRKTARYLTSLQKESGCFGGDEWGEEDSRFAYAAVCAIKVISTWYPHISQIINWDEKGAADYLLACQSEVDCGFGACPGAESHGGQVFCCVAGLALLNQLHRIKCTQGLLEWLRTRQQLYPMKNNLSNDSDDLEDGVVVGGGFNGRPQKDVDVCYSWWILSALAILDNQNLGGIDRAALKNFILSSQDPTEAEDEHDSIVCIADRPGDVGDLYHTFFGLAGLSILQSGDGGPFAPLRSIDPVMALCRMKDDDDKV